jgi:hypothetical protein
MSDFSAGKININNIEDNDVAIVLKALMRRRFSVYYALDEDAARDIVLSLIPLDAKVGTGDSTTVKQLGLPDALEKRGTIIHRNHTRGLTFEESVRLANMSYSQECEYFLTGTNAVTLDGRLVNVDGTGNRVAGMFYGHKHSIIIIGRNKITKNLDHAFDRIRNLIAPQHVKIRSTDLGGRIFKTGCVETGICVDCQGENRICNIFTVIEGKPSRTNIHVIVVDKDLGLGWDISWPDSRVQNIVEAYKKFVWFQPRDSSAG